MDNKIKNLYFFFILIFSGLATVFYRSQEGIISLFFISLFIQIYFKLRFSKNLVIAIAIWLLYSLILFFAHSLFTPFFIFRHLVYILTTYVIISLFKETLFIKFENAIYYFSIISLFFYSWQTFHYQSLISIGQMLDLSNEAFINRPYYYNILIYTIDHYPTQFLQRNSGFCWEPGPFSIYIIIAIYINLIRNNFKIKENTRLYILFITLITTQSTTGLMAFGALVAYLLYFEMKNRSKYIILPIAIAIFIYAFFTLPFMYGKITELYQSGIEIEETVMVYGQKTGKSYSSGRFGGIIIGWHDFKNHPLWGIGGYDELSYGNIGYSKVFIVNGLASIMSTYGLFGIILYLIFTFKTSKNLAFIIKSKSKWSFFIIIISSSFAFTLENQILLFTLIFSSLFLKPQIITSKFPKY